jgi:putative Mg2+ transporter-C (MgtC) family protein
MNEILLKLILSAIAGGLIGAEREYRVGFGMRTLMLICLGSTMFTIYSSYYAFGEGDPRRIAAAVVSGVGFLGAGMILRHQGSILGLTTAATVWLVAALGMGIGLGYYQLVIVATLLVILILWGIPRFLKLINARLTNTYEIKSTGGEKVFEQIVAIFEGNGLEITQSTASKKDELITYLFRTYGSQAQHQDSMVAFIDHSEFNEFRVL